MCPTKLQSVSDRRLRWCANASTEIVNQNHRLGCQTICALLSIRLRVHANRILRATGADETTWLRTVVCIFVCCHGIHRSLEGYLQRHWSRGGGFVVIRGYYCSCDNCETKGEMDVALRTVDVYDTQIIYVPPVNLLSATFTLACLLGMSVYKLAQVLKSHPLRNRIASTSIMSLIASPTD